MAESNNMRIDGGESVGGSLDTPGIRDEMRRGSTSGCDITVGNYMNFIRPYTGERNSEQTIEQFLDSVKEVAGLVGWSDMVVKLVIRAKLKGPAYEFFVSSPTITQTSNPIVIRNAMCDRFGMRKSSGDLLSQLLTCKQGKNESVGDYALRLEALQFRINMQLTEGRDGTITPVLLKGIFMEGLMDAIRVHMIARPISSFEQAIDLASTIQNELRSLGHKKISTVLMTMEGENSSSPKDNVLHPSRSVPSDKLEKQYDEMVMMLNSLDTRLAKYENGVGSRNVGKGEIKREIERSPLDERHRMKKNKVVTIVTIKQRRVKCVIDTGAEISFLSEGFVNSLGIAERMRSVPERTLRGFGNKLTRDDRRVQIHFWFDIGTQRITSEFAVFEDEVCIGQDMVLGMDFLDDHRAAIDLDEEVLKFRGRPVAHIEREVTDGKMIGLLEVVRQSVLSEHCHERDDVKLKQGDVISTIMRKYGGVFAKGILDLKCAKGFTHEVELTNYRPVNKPQYTYCNATRERVKEKINEFLEAGIIERSSSPWNNPLIATPKKDGDVRLVLDARSINGITKRIDYPLVKTQDVLAGLGGNVYYSVIDLESGYYQVNLGVRSRQFFAFRTPWGKYQYCRMPQGAANSAFYFQQVIEKVLDGILGKNVYCFQDDVLIATPTFEQHVNLIERVLERFQEYDIMVKAKKCELFKREVKYLGHILTKQGFRPDPGNIASISDFIRPSTVKGIRSFMGGINYYARFVPMLSEIAKPITDLLRGNHKSKDKVKWTTEAQSAFVELKRVLVQQPCLGCPDYARPFRISVHSSSSSIASTLEQEQQCGPRIIGYFSRKLRASELNYNDIEREALSVVESLSHFEYIIMGYPIEIGTTHKSVECLMNLREGNMRMNKWAVRILKYAPDFLTLGEKRNVLATMLVDALDSASVKADTDVEGEAKQVDTDECCVKNMDVLDSASVKTDTHTDVGEVKQVYTDGCCVKNGKEGAQAAIGVFWEDGSPLNVSERIIGSQSNNRAELLAVCKALNQAKELGLGKISIVTDSRYVMDCVSTWMPNWKINGWKTYNNKDVLHRNDLEMLDGLLNEVATKFEHVSGHSGNFGNEMANGLAVKAITVHEIEPIVALVHTSQKIDTNTDNIRELQSKDDECIGIMENLRSLASEWRDGSLCYYKNKAGLLSVRGKIKIGQGGETYIDSVCLPLAMRDPVIMGVHASKWVCHSGFITTSRAVLEKYFWVTWRRDIERNIRTCKGCQRISVIRGKAKVIDFPKPSGPFEVVAIDIIGPLNKTGHDNKYILTAIDLFSRYVALSALPDQTSITIARALEISLISHHGCPVSFLTDNGSNFTSKLFEEVCTLLDVRHRCVAPYRPQSNGMVERANRSVKERLTHLIDDNGEDWDRNLHLAQYAINTSIHSSTKHAPSEVIYGRMLRLPGAELLGSHERVSIPNYCEELRHKLHVIHEDVATQERATRSIRNKGVNSKRNTRTLEIGDMVLYKKPRVSASRGGKFSYPLEGPYEIMEKLSPVLYWIVKCDTKSKQRGMKVHVDRLKVFRGEEDSRSDHEVPSEKQSDKHEEGNESEYEDTDGETNIQDHVCRGTKGGQETVVTKDLPYAIGDKNQVSTSGRMDTENQGGKFVGDALQGREEVVSSAKKEGPVPSSSRYNTRSQGKVDSGIYDRFKFVRGQIFPKGV